MLSRGFTLIELLVVVALLAALASFGWSSYAHVYDDAHDNLAHVQLDEVAKALRRFRAETGFWPGEGPFRVSSDCSSDSAALDPAQHSAMAADLQLLNQAPRFCSGMPTAQKNLLAQWNPSSARGWHGPYLEPDSFAWVRMSQIINGNVFSRIINGVSAGKPFQTKHREQYAWYSNSDANADDLQQRGRPIYFYPPRREGAVLFPASVVSAGGDGDFGADPEFDSRDCVADSSNDRSKDNLVVCLQ